MQDLRREIETCLVYLIRSVAENEPVGRFGDFECSNVRSKCWRKELTASAGRSLPLHKVYDSWVRVGAPAKPATRHETDLRRVVGPCRQFGESEPEQADAYYAPYPTSAGRTQPGTHDLGGSPQQPKDKVWRPNICKANGMTLPAGNRI